MPFYQWPSRADIDICIAIASQAGQLTLKNDGFDAS
jgi:hypothetical protein